jgi:hypothetical protein
VCRFVPSGTVFWFTVRGLASPKPMYTRLSSILVLYITMIHIYNGSSTQYVMRPGGLVSEYIIYGDVVRRVVANGFLT